MAAYLESTLTSLRNPTTFPPFSEIFQENNWNFEYRNYCRQNGYHTAFIGEISREFANYETDNGLNRRASFFARDITDNEFLIVLGNIRHDILGGWKIGDTIILLDPVPQEYTHDGNGLCDFPLSGYFLEFKDLLSSVKLFPYRYEDVLYANDLYFRLTSNPPTCSNPICPNKNTTTSAGAPSKSDNNRPKLRQCKRCAVTKYCNERCQSHHWVFGGDGMVAHSEVCRLLADVQWFTARRWSGVEVDEGKGKEIQVCAQNADSEGFPVDGASIKLAEDATLAANWLVYLDNTSAGDDGMPALSGRPADATDDAGAEDDLMETMDAMNLSDDSSTAEDSDGAMKSTTTVDSGAEDNLMQTMGAMKIDD